MTKERKPDGPDQTLDQDLEDILADAINDSLDVDWTGRDCARAILRMLAEEGLAIVEVPPPFNRGDECPTSHDGRCHVDTSMESGPNNCFHCERPMR